MNMRMMKRKVWGGLLMAAWLMATSAPLKAQTTPMATGNEGNATLSSMVQPTRLTPRQYASRPTWETLKGEITLYMTNDMGRNGYYEQKPIAELMGEMPDRSTPSVCWPWATFIISMAWPRYRIPFGSPISSGSIRIPTSCSTGLPCVATTSIVATRRRS